AGQLALLNDLDIGIAGPGQDVRDRAPDRPAADDRDLGVPDASAALLRRAHLPAGRPDEPTLRAAPFGPFSSGAASRCCRARSASTCCATRAARWSWSPAGAGPVRPARKDVPICARSARVVTIGRRGELGFQPPA